MIFLNLLKSKFQSQPVMDLKASPEKSQKIPPPPPFPPCSEPKALPELSTNQIDNGLHKLEVLSEKLHLVELSEPGYLENKDTPFKLRLAALGFVGAGLGFLYDLTKHLKNIDNVYYTPSKKLTFSDNPSGEDVQTQLRKSLEKIDSAQTSNDLYKLSRTIRETQFSTTFHCKTSKGIFKFNLKLGSKDHLLDLRAKLKSEKYDLIETEEIVKLFQKDRILLKATLFEKHNTNINFKFQTSKGYFQFKTTSNTPIKDLTKELKKQGHPSDEISTIIKNLKDNNALEKCRQDAYEKAENYLRRTLNAIRLPAKEIDNNIEKFKLSSKLLNLIRNTKVTGTNDTLHQTPANALEQLNFDAQKKEIRQIFRKFADLEGHPLPAEQMFKPPADLCKNLDIPAKPSIEEDSSSQPLVAADFEVSDPICEADFLNKKAYIPPLSISLARG